MDEPRGRYITQKKTGTAKSCMISLPFNLQKSNSEDQNRMVIAQA